jgi:ribonuclease D
MRIITTNLQLFDFCHTLLSSKIPLAIGIDTEFNRERTYWPDLCLIQVATPEESLIIDPLSITDFTPFQALLVAPHITKVLHSARQDIEIFWHEWHTLPNNFFDTQIAATVCGLGEGMGYSALVKNLYNHDLEKDSRYTNWMVRPLTDKQLTYAINDVVYLLPIFHDLTQRLTQLNRLDWIADDILTLLTPGTYDVDPQTAWLRIHTHRHKPQNLAILQNICAWREINAIRLNVNRGRLLKDETILKIGLTSPQSVKEMKALLTKSAFLTDILIDELFAIYQAALKQPKTTWPLPLKKPILSELTHNRLKLLQDKLAQIAEDMSVPPRLIAPKADLIALADGQREGNRLLTGWRFEVFGGIALEILDRS